MRWLFVVVGIVALSLTLVRTIPSFQMVVVDPFGEGFSDPALSDAANGVLSEALEKAKALNEHVRWWRNVAFWAGISALGSTALATLLAGLRRRKLPNEDEDFLNKKITQIGLLTALASFANMTHEFANTTVDPLEKGFSTLRIAIRATPAELKAAQGEEAGILAELKLVIERNAP